MSATILGGRAGTLLYHIIDRIGECYHAGHKALLLVPEQYTLQAERELLDRLKLPGYFNIDILSPSRLRSKVRDTAGGGTFPQLDASGKAVAFSCALKETGKSLVYYGRSVDQAGLPARMASLTEDLANAGLDPDSLRELTSHYTGSLKAKMDDIASVWSAYIKLTDGRMTDALVRDRETIARLEKSRLADQTDVFVYGFDVLHRPFCELLCEL